MHIHFICTGNAYRSRLAEAYLKSKGIRKLQVSSSGTEAHLNKNGPICWYTARLIIKHNLVPHTKLVWEHTTPTHIDDADIIIFMDQKHYDHVKTLHNLQNKKYEVWHIPDLNDVGLSAIGGSDSDDIATIRHTEQTFDQIRKNVDKLIQGLELSL